MKIHNTDRLEVLQEDVKFYNSLIFEKSYDINHIRHMKKICLDEIRKIKKEEKKK